MAPDLKNIFDQMIELASRYAGATSPNPCVAAAALNAHGKVLSIQAHERAGEAHAEAKVLADLRTRGIESQAKTLLVTLEPCNHTGRTPPCSEAILGAKSIETVIFGAYDPNLRVKGGGAERLRAEGLEVIGPRELDPEISSRCEALIRTFSHWVKTSLPWVTIKSAINLEGTMIPPTGQKTFTSPESLKLAHELRRRADAIMTGSGTILADSPLFTIRHVTDHPAKTRWIALQDRRLRVPESWIQDAEQRGFRVHRGRDLKESLRFLGEQGVLEVLVEAGPTLTQSLLEGGIWNQHVVIQQEPGIPDHVEVRFRPA